VDDPIAHFSREEGGIMDTRREASPYPADLTPSQIQRIIAMHYPQIRRIGYQRERQTC